LANFVACWDGLDDPRKGNAARHDFPEILIIAVRGSVRRPRLRGLGPVRDGEGAVFARFSQARAWRAEPRHSRACRRAAAFFACSIRRGSGRRFSASWRGFPGNAKAVWPYLARSSATRSIRPAASRRCHGQRLGLRAAAGAGADRHGLPINPKRCAACFRSAGGSLKSSKKPGRNRKYRF
jgi:hypothetical protein